MTIIILMVFSFPVFSKMMNGQVNILLMVFAGEFLRYALIKKPVLSGAWLGGLLLKPQLLIPVVPILLIKRNWRVLMGLISSSAMIGLSSGLLSGFGASNSVLNPEAMINWLMIGGYVNTVMNTPLGWVITGFGLFLTILAIYALVKWKTVFGSPEWVLTILGVFSGTIPILWHAQYHTALILIPFLIYVTVNNLLPEKIIYLWVGLTLLTLLGLALVSPLVLFYQKLISLLIREV